MRDADDMRDARDTRDAPVILGNPPGSFAWGVLVRRHPALIEQVRGAFPYAPTQHRRLDALLREITDGVIEPLAPGDDHDRAQWEEWGREYVGRSWFDAPFLWVESYFYRRLLSAVGYFGPGPWQGIDPFGPFKRAELHGDAVAEELAALDDLGRLTSEEQATALLRARSGGTGPISGSVWTPTRVRAPGTRCRVSSPTTARCSGHCCPWAPTACISSPTTRAGS